MLVPDGHLGGFIRGGDPDTFDLKIFEELVKLFSPKNLIDIGCGEGHSLKWFLENKIDASGIEGSKLAINNSPVPSKIILHDYCVGPFKTNQEVDLAWSCEFVEHVESKYVQNFMETFNCCKNVAMTYSETQWQGHGHHHVNCQNQEYWNEMFSKNGFIFNKELTLYLRSLATARWVKPTLSIYRKK